MPESIAVVRFPSSFVGIPRGPQTELCDDARDNVRESPISSCMDDTHGKPAIVPITNLPVFLLGSSAAAPKKNAESSDRRHVAKRLFSDLYNAPRRTRTFDPLIKSQLLYQLS